MTDVRADCFSQNYTEFLTGELFCKPIFDGFTCWSATKAGTLAEQPCPSNSNKKNATRYCETTGNWRINEDTKKPWTNYSQCWVFYDASNYAVEFDKNDEKVGYEWFQIMKSITHVGYWCSLLLLIMSLLIFLSVRRLYCARNRLHMHLFASFILRASMYLIKEFLFIDGVALYSDVVYIPGKGIFVKGMFSWQCKLVTTIWNYAILANYMLILMEGVYLHNLIYSKLFSDNNRVTLYYCFGWGMPIAFIIPWIILRKSLDNLMCWTTSTNKYISMLVQKPLEISVIINFLLFITIIKVLCTKVNSMNVQQRKNKYSRLIKSTLTLILLFGVPYVIFIMVYFSDNETLQNVWLFYDQVFTAFQGFFVALLYCLLNSEVQMEMKQKYNRLRDRRWNVQRSRNPSQTQQYSMPLKEETAPKSPDHWYNSSEM